MTSQTSKDLIEKCRRLEYALLMLLSLKRVHSHTVAEALGVSKREVSKRLRIYRRTEIVDILAPNPTPPLVAYFQALETDNKPTRTLN